MEAPNSVASETTTMTTIVVESIELHSISQLAPDAQVHHHETAPSYPVIDIAWTNVVSGMPTVAARSDVCEFEHATISNFLKGSKWYLKISFLMSIILFNYYTKLLTLFFFFFFVLYQVT